MREISHHGTVMFRVMSEVVFQRGGCTKTHQTRTLLLGTRWENYNHLHVEEQGTTRWWRGVRVVPCRGKRSSVAMIACVRCLLLWKLRWLRFRVVVCEMLTSLMPSSLKAFRRSASSRIGMGSRMRFFTMVAADCTRHTPGCRAGREAGWRPRAEFSSPK